MGAADDALISTKHSWTPSVAQSLLWSAEKALMLDAVRDCGATPSWVNDSDDDGAAIGACLLRSSNSGSSGATVFVPRGEFALRSQLVLRSNQRESANNVFEFAQVPRREKLFDLIRAEEIVENPNTILGFGTGLIGAGKHCTTLMMIAAPLFATTALVKVDQVWEEIARVLLSRENVLLGLILKLPLIFVSISATG